MGTFLAKLLLIAKAKSGNQYSHEFVAQKIKRNTFSLCKSKGGHKMLPESTFTFSIHVLHILE